jgi:peptide-methionine (S)-S-oxide reductase
MAEHSTAKVAFPAVKATRRSGHGPTRAAAALLLAALATTVTALAEERQAYFAGGCFWCVEADFQKLDGVGDVVSGFTGGTLENPTYRGNHEGHFEAVEVNYDSDVITYEELVRYFWRHIDPLDDGGQFCDRGFSYRTAIFVSNDEERAIAEVTRAEVDALFPDDAVATEIRPATRFWPVEAYHQEYADKNPLRYGFYRRGCGRDARIADLWDDKTWETVGADSH